MGQLEKSMYLKYIDKYKVQRLYKIKRYGILLSVLSANAGKQLKYCIRRHRELSGSIQPLSANYQPQKDAGVFCNNYI